MQRVSYQPQSGSLTLAVMSASGTAQAQVETPIKVGFIGAGFIAEWHAKALRAVPGVTLAAICDRDEGRARSIAAKFAIQVSVSSMEEMLRPGHGLAAVHVLLPPQYHAPAARMALEAGVHVLLEKPMGTDAAECAALAELARRSDRRIAVSHNFLLYPVYERLINDIQSGTLGFIDHVRVTWAKELPQITMGPFHHWMFAKPENLILEIGPHSVAHLLHLGRVCAKANGEDPTMGDPDIRVSKPIWLPGGRLAFQRWGAEAMCGSTAMELEWSFVPSFGEHQIRVRGSLGSATVDFERNLYLAERHTGGHVDFDRYSVLSGMAKQALVQGRRNLAQYVCGKLGVIKTGNMFAVSIANAMQNFYAAIGGARMDERIDSAMGQQVLEWCQRIGAVAARRAPTPTGKHGLGRGAASGADVLVLGGSGFIGRVLVRKLADAGHVVRVVSRHGGDFASRGSDGGIEVVQGDVRRAEDLDRVLRGVRYVFHLALGSASSWAEWYEEDVLATQRVGNKCVDHGVRRLVYASTIAALDGSNPERTISDATPVEDHRVLHELYSKAKSASEEVLREVRKKRGLDVVIVRPGIVLGCGGPPWHAGIAKWSFNRVAQLWGDGRVPLPIVLVDDVADAMVSAMTAADVSGMAFNLVGPPMLTAREYIAELEAYCGIKFEVKARPIWLVYGGEVCKWIVKVAVGHQPRHRPRLREWQSRQHLSSFDCSGAARLLGWRPVRDRAAAIERGIHRPAEEFIVRAAGVRPRVMRGE